MNIQLRVLDERIGRDWPLPAIQTAGSAGMDLRACLNAPFDLQPNQTEMISTGLAMHIADPGYAAVILARSGQAMRGLVMGNQIGLIDSDYQGELRVLCWNRSDAVIRIEPGERIAQLVVLRVVVPQFSLVDEFAPTERGTNGFGSTGTS
ncbi:MAG: dUTP diphosphatase [Gammaproteobacteria bacterium AqS3]|nr:dUTP diphosphatase [Gammaproteobacteria bacterium AqS3]